MCRCLVSGVILNYMNENIVYVPIGTNCSIAEFLRKTKLRRCALPFDWAITPVTSALQLIENRFQGFLEPENLVFLEPTKRFLYEEDGVTLRKSSEIVTPVICRRYGMLFPHDFSARGRDDLENVRAKYGRRIERLMGLLGAEDGMHLVYVQRPLLKWQKKQYRAAGVSYKELDEDELKALYAKLSLGNSSLIHLEDLKLTHSCLLPEEPSGGGQRSIWRKLRRQISN